MRKRLLLLLVISLFIFCGCGKGSNNNVNITDDEIKEEPTKDKVIINNSNASSFLSANIKITNGKDGNLTNTLSASTNIWFNSKNLSSFNMSSPTTTNIVASGYVSFNYLYLYNNKYIEKEKIQYFRIILLKNMNFSNINSVSVIITEPYGSKIFGLVDVELFVTSFSGTLEYK